jgi:SpoU rRNA methylase family enzyme
MEEFLVKGQRYTFYTSSKVFNAVFEQITGPNDTLHVTKYNANNDLGTVPGVRTMPFSWIKNIEVYKDPEDDIEIIDLSHTLISNKKKKKKQMIDNFML